MRITWLKALSHQVGAALPAGAQCGLACAEPAVLQQLCRGGTLCGVLQLGRHERVTTLHEMCLPFIQHVEIKCNECAWATCEYAQCSHLVTRCASKGVQSQTCAALTFWKQRFRNACKSLVMPSGSGTSASWTMRYRADMGCRSK